MAVEVQWFSGHRVLETRWLGAELVPTDRAEYNLALYHFGHFWAELYLDECFLFFSVLQLNFRDGYERM